MRVLTAFILGVVASLLALVVVAAAVLHGGGLSAQPEPSDAEEAVAEVARDWAMPSEAKKARNPVVLTPEALREAEAHFTSHCASCHGADGRGKTEMGQGLYPRTPNLTSKDSQEMTDGEIFYTIENGVRLTGMPAWGKPGKADESWKLVHLIRRLPQLSEKERAEMEAMVPRSTAE